MFDLVLIRRNYTAGYIYFDFLTERREIVVYIGYQALLINR